MILSKANRKVFAWFLSGLAAMFFASCASNPYAKLDEAVIDREDFAGGLVIIDESLAEGGESIYDAKTAEDGGIEGGNAISLLLDKGLIAHYGALAGQSIEGKGPVEFKASSANLTEAERKIEEATAGNTAQSILTFITNDTSKDYAGEVYEDIYLTIFNALNYYQRGDVDNAIALARSVSEKITAYSDEFGKSLDSPENSDEAAGDGSEEDGALTKAVGEIMGSIKGKMSAIVTTVCTSLGVSGEPLEFSNSALANYIAALAFRAKGDEGSARVSLVNLNKAFSGDKSVYKNPVPAALKISGEVNAETAEELNVPAGKSRLNIVAFAGLSPLKYEANYGVGDLSDVPSLTPITGGGNLIGIFVPAMIDRPNNFPADKPIVIPVGGPTLIQSSDRNANRKIEVHIENGPSFKLELLEDMGAVVKGIFRNKLPGILFKTVLRVAAKYVVVGTAASQTNNSLAKIGIIAAGKSAIEASEGADLRMGRYFPGAAYVGGVTLDPGVYTITIRYDDGYTVKKENFEVKAGGINLLEAVNLK